MRIYTDYDTINYRRIIMKFFITAVLFFMPGLLNGSQMKIVIGTTNPAKIAALAELMPEYDVLKSAELISKNVPSGISEQPLSLEETMHGAQNRAQAAAAYGDIGFGIESGLFKMPGINRYMDVCVCCIYSDNKTAFGFSSAFEIPPRILTYILDQHMDLSQATKMIGLTDNDQIGAAEGVIGILTKGRITRKEYTKQAIMMALMQLEWNNLFTITQVKN